MRHHRRRTSEVIKKTAILEPGRSAPQVNIRASTMTALAHIGRNEIPQTSRGRHREANSARTFPFSHEANEKKKMSKKKRNVVSLIGSAHRNAMNLVRGSQGSERCEEFARLLSNIKFIFFNIATPRKLGIIYFILHCCRRRRRCRVLPALSISDLLTMSCFIA